jgi:hypothetical protein
MTPNTATALAYKTALTKGLKGATLIYPMSSGKCPSYAYERAQLGFQLADALAEWDSILIHDLTHTTKLQVRTRSFLRAHLPTQIPAITQNEAASRRMCPFPMRTARRISFKHRAQRALSACFLERVHHPAHPQDDTRPANFCFRSISESYRSAN